MAGSKGERRALWTGAVAVSLVALAWLACSYHVVYGAGLSPRLVRKVSWSPSETLVNLDELAPMPTLVVRARYPLFLQADTRALMQDVREREQREGAARLTEYQRSRDQQRAASASQR